MCPLLNTTQINWNRWCFNCWQFLQTVYAARNWRRCCSSSLKDLLKQYAGSSFLSIRITVWFFKVSLHLFLCFSKYPLCLSPIILNTYYNRFPVYRLLFMLHFTSRYLSVQCLSFQLVSLFLFLNAFWFSRYFLNGFVLFYVIYSLSVTNLFLSILTSNI